MTQLGPAKKRPAVWEWGSGNLAEQPDDVQLKKPVTFSLLPMPRLKSLLRSYLPLFQWHIRNVLRNLDMGQFEKWCLYT